MKLASKKRGFALATALLLTVVFLMILGVTVSVARHGAVFGGESSADIEALYAAEAGVAYALANWSADDAKTWTTQEDNHPLPGGLSSFTLKFGPGESVNNFNQGAAADSSMGPHSVPADMGYVVVTGHARGRSHRIEVLVSRGGLFEEPVALAGGGKLELIGDVDIRGLRSMSELVKTDVQVFTTSSAAGPLVTHQGPGTLHVQGSVSANAGNAAAISNAFRAPGAVSGQLKTGASQSLPITVDIPNRVTQAAASSPLTPSFAGAATTLSPVAGKKDYYINGPLNYNGNLDLQDVNLYVNGDFSVNGGIRGKGSVFVTGRTSLRGDTSIRCSDDNGLALFSGGDAELKGFDGSSYLQSLASGQVDADSEAEHLLVTGTARTIHYTEHIATLSRLSAEMATQAQNYARDVKAGTTQVASDHVRFKAGASLAAFEFGSQDRSGFPVGNAGLVSPFDVLFGLTVANVSNMIGPTGLYRTENAGVLDIGPGMADPLRKLKFLLKAQDTPEKQFLYRKFNELNGVDPDAKSFFGPVNSQVSDPNWPHGLFGGVQNPVDRLARLDAAYATGSVDGLIDALNDAVRTNGAGMSDEKRLKLSARLTNVLEQMDFNHLGRGYFQGVIYTDGKFTADNDVQIIGSLIAKNDITLRNGVDITSVPELTRRAGQSLGRVTVRQWVRR